MDPGAHPDPEVAGRQHHSCVSGAAGSESHLLGDCNERALATSGEVRSACGMELELAPQVLMTAVRTHAWGQGNLPYLTSSSASHSPSMRAAARRQPSAS